MTENAKTFDYTNYKIIDEQIVFEKDEDGKDVKTVIKIVEFDNSAEKQIKKNESLKRAMKKYREKNKEELNKKIAESNKIRYQNDEEYREYVRQKRREYYVKNKK